jgi:hypothetical protein
MRDGGRGHQCLAEVVKHTIARLADDELGSMLKPKVP